jgi:proline iminopeptidase
MSPVRESFAVAGDDVRLWTCCDGSGPPLVLSHGGPGMWDYLEDLAGLIQDAATVIRWEQRGCGRSDRAGPYSVARSIEDLDSVRRYHGLDRWVVGGHSWGASLALQYALTYSERVAGLVYISGTGIGQSWNAAYHAEADRRLTVEQRQELERLRGLPDRSRDEEMRYRTLSWMPDFADPYRAEELAAQEASAPFTTNYECNAIINAETKTWSEDDLFHRTSALAVPTLVIHGGLDPRPASAVDSLVEAVPNAELHVIPEAGHHPWVEAPEEMVSILRMFLANLDLSGWEADSPAATRK